MLSKEILLKIEWKDMDTVVLTNSKGDTYTSKSEELQDFLHGEPPPPVQSDSGVEGKILQMAMARHPVSESKMIAYKEGLEHGYQLAEPKTKELMEALEDALSNLNEIADCTNGRLREMAETAANKITKALNNNQ